MAEAIPQLMRLKPTSCSSIAAAGVDAVANKSRLMAAHVRMEIVSAIATLQKFNR
jgi:hypothetical protein